MRRLVVTAVAVSAAVAALLCVRAGSAAQQPQVWLVAFQTGDGEAARYVGTSAQGGLNASGAKITPKQIFKMLDINGGSLSNGDKVKLAWEASLWREDKEKGRVHRVPAKGAPEAECLFVIRLKGKNILLETPSGRFVSSKADGPALLTTDKQDASSLFVAIPNPTPQP